MQDILNTVHYLSSGIAAMDNAVRKLCAELEGSQAPRPDGDIEIEIILKSEY